MVEIRRTVRFRKEDEAVKRWLDSQIAEIDAYEANVSPDEIDRDYIDNRIYFESCLRLIYDLEDLRTEKSWRLSPERMGK